MPYYRLYFQDAQGHFVRFEELDAASDQEALAHAREIFHPYGIEVWHFKRMVGTVHPDDAE